MPSWSEILHEQGEALRETRVEMVASRARAERRDAAQQEVILILRDIRQVLGEIKDSLTAANDSA